MPSKPNAPSRGLRTTEFGLVSAVVLAALSGQVSLPYLAVAAGLVAVYAVIRAWAKRG